MSSFDSSSEEEGILKKALDVELPEDFDPSKAPTTGNKLKHSFVYLPFNWVLLGEEYLHHVMYERKQCRKWVTVDIDRSRFKNKETIQIPLVTTKQFCFPALSAFVYRTNQSRRHPPTYCQPRNGKKTK